MSDMLRKIGIEVGRRKFLASALTATFGAFTAVAARNLDAYAITCSSCNGPFGGGYCGAELCTGNPCGYYDYGSYQVSCSNTTCCCSGSNCWTLNGGGMCCDCICWESIGGSYFYCACLV